VKVVVRSLLAAIAIVVIGCVTFGAVLAGSGWRAFVVHTGSMTPHIPSGDLVIDRPPGPVHVGEVITFAKAPGQYTTHRVAAITPQGIETKGDANPSNDFGYVTRSQVIGRVYAVIPFAGFVVVFCSHWQGVVGVVLLLWAIWLAWSLFLGREEAEAAPTLQES
jgi:signal peptidase I